MNKKSLLFVHHTLQPPGGGNTVAAWALQALREHYDITLLTWVPVDLDPVNTVYGTDLRPSDFKEVNAAPRLRRFLTAIPLPLALFTSNIMFRATKRLTARHKFDRVFCAINEIDAGVPAVQYIHYPSLIFPRPDVDYRWFHIQPFLGMYRWLSLRIGGYSLQAVTDNLALANSDWTGALHKERHKADARTVYPPVPGGFPDIPIDDRENAFACIGRLSPEKEIDDLIAILHGVREAGHDIRFHIIGPIDKPAYYEGLRQRAEPHSDWITFNIDLSRDDLVHTVSRCKYGIHGMKEEHFGIAPAELQKAGCITFVANGGGAVEIVGRDERLIYDDIPDAVSKICRMLEDETYRSDLQAGVEERRFAYSEDRFMAEVVDAVESFPAHPDG